MNRTADCAVTAQDTILAVEIGFPPPPPPTTGLFVPSNRDDGGGGWVEEVTRIGRLWTTETQNHRQF